MKVISLWQPWASLVIDGRKKIETRHWSPPASLVGQPLAIHAAKKVDIAMAHKWGYNSKTIPRGAVLGVVKITHTQMFDEAFCEMISIYTESQYGNFKPGRYGWFLKLLEKLPEPIPCRGHQGIFNWECPLGNYVIEEVVK